jgi:hypothetical protein
MVSTLAFLTVLLAAAYYCFYSLSRGEAPATGWPIGPMIKRGDHPGLFWCMVILAGLSPGILLVLLLAK